MSGSDALSTPPPPTSPAQRCGQSLAVALDREVAVTPSLQSDFIPAFLGLSEGVVINK